MEGAAASGGPTAAVPARMTTVSRHYFGGGASERDHDLRVDIIENIEEDYGMFVWPCSIILAEYVWQQRSRFSGSKVVELGAGTSLPGLVAAKVGADVTLTDIAHNTEVLDNITKICKLNDASCTVSGLTWGDWDESIFDLHPDIILGADVLYDSSNFDDLFATVTFLLENSPGAVFITTYHNRRETFNLLKLCLTRKNINDTQMSFAGVVSYVTVLQELTDSIEKRKGIIWPSAYK